MDQNNPALVAARNSWQCVRSKDREAWLSLMADDILIEDPIGLAPTNPSGEGIRGKEALLAFWEQNLSPAEVEIEIHESFAAGSESAHRMTLRTTYPGGVTFVVNGIFTYRVNEAGKLTNLRGYWSVEDMETEQAS